jgi:hypothetical protein
LQINSGLKRIENLAVKNSVSINGSHLGAGSYQNKSKTMAMAGCEIKKS